MNQATNDFIERFKDEKSFSLALKAKSFPDVDMRFALRQIEGMRIAKEKLPTWFAYPLLYPEHLPLEQCSSEMTARYKAELVSGTVLLDLTGGFGVDCFFLSEKFHHTIYVERNSDLCELSRENFKTLGASVEVVCDNAIHFLQTRKPKVDVIFIDPARRNSNGGKVVSLKDCEPDLSEIMPLLFDASATIMVKLSPMLDVISVLRMMRGVKEVHIIAVDNECKELLLIFQKGCESEPVLHCVNITKRGRESFVFRPSEEQNTDYEVAQKLGNYLYEPNVTILKAGAFKLMSHCFHLYKLHANSHLYTSDIFVTEFPGRKFEIVRQFGFSKQHLAELHQIVSGKCNLTVRNFPVSVADLRKKLHLKEGGEFYLFATIINKEKVLILCRKSGA
jgi:hypothetical protein